MGDDVVQFPGDPGTFLPRGVRLGQVGVGVAGRGVGGGFGTGPDDPTDRQRAGREPEQREAEQLASRADRLLGVRLGLVAAMALGVLSMTSEYRTRTIGLTFVASPYRGRVLAAKATVLSGVVFLAGLGASLAAFALTPPLQARGGYGPPAYPVPRLTDPGVPRAIVGTALFLVLVALLSLAVGTVIRRATGAVITLLALFLVVPTVVAQVSGTANAWVGRVTPIAGLAVQRTVDVPGENVIGPWAGFAVLGAYTAAALTVALLVLKRRDA
jgi:ABC-type transport system involved in multi-copper enzyme maturation permease subunit